MAPGDHTFLDSWLPEENKIYRDSAEVDQVAADLSDQFSRYTLNGKARTIKAKIVSLIGVVFIQRLSRHKEGIGRRFSLA